MADEPNVIELQAKVGELQVKVAELDKDNRKLVRDEMSRKDAFQKLEAKHAKLLDDMKAAGIQNPEENIGEQIANASGKTEVEKALKKLEKQAKEDHDQVVALLADKDKLTRETNHAKIASVLKENMKDIIGADDTIESYILRDKVKLNKDGKIVALDDDGDEITVDKFVENFKKKNPDRIKVAPNPGSGGSGGGGPEGSRPGESPKKLKQSEYNALSLEGKKAFYATTGNGVIPD